MLRLSCSLGRKLLLLVAVLVLTAGCDSASNDDSQNSETDCVAGTENLKKGAERGSIEALTDPPVQNADEVDNLNDSDRVLALLVGNTPLAVPRKLLNQHEIVNLNNWLSDPITVTYCPLTQSSLAFDRTNVSGAEFGVSGLLLHDNLVMVDRRENESLWPQMRRSAICGSASGTALDMIPIIDLEWGHWRELHPDTKVLPVAVQNASSERRRTSASNNLPHAASASGATTPSGPVLGLPGAGLADEGGKGSSGDGVAVPFQALDDGSLARAVEITSDTGPVVFWNREARAAMAYDTSTSFSVTEDGRFVDEITGSTWTLDGRAVDGPRQGERLPPVKTAYVALWSAWSEFHPETEVWESP